MQGVDDCYCWADKTIKKLEFLKCRGLTTVTLGDGLEQIGEYAFTRCELIHEINTPNAIKIIKKTPFFSCPGLTTDTCKDGP